ncbi:ferric reduction oxidase 6-like [Euphorbia lathyris]|uniref:ferric reduction oxidase 6-like n=1 Tax=Euphorbia lathyris TaxID=212925 RepID=UPI003313A6A8
MMTVGYNLFKQNQPLMHAPHFHLYKMDQNSNAQQLLLSTTNRNVKNTTTILLKWVMKIMMFLFFILWIAIIFIYPLESAVAWIKYWTDATSSSFLGFTGSTFVLFSGPIIAISILSLLYLSLNSHQEDLKERSRKVEKARARYKLWTFPVVVGGPLGVVSAAELIGIGVFGVFVIWVAGVYVVQKLSVLFVNPDYTTYERWSWVFRMSGRGCGLTGIFCLSFMFIPVARGSSLLRLLNISSMHAIRYHIWLAHLCMCLFTSHGFLYLIGWFMSGEIPSELISWTPTNGANLAGIINIFFGWTIWITSLPFVRQKNFELFYYTHHLYIIFIIFLAMHVGNFFFCIVAGPIFLFIIDRFLRFCQSRHTVHVISTTSFPCGVVQLVMSTPQTKSLNYNALSTIFLQIKELSLLQWHPFSVSNTRLDGKNRLSVLIKTCGNWTSQFEDHALNFKVAKQLRLHDSTRLTAAVEGPYGSESSVHLMYEHLILVGGGIGISPFIAVLSDVIHRIQLGEPCLPRNIFLVWAVKTSDQLSLLSTIDDIPAIPSHDLNLQILIYVTRQSQPPSENVVVEKPITCCIGGGNSISVLASTGNKTWFAAYVISSSVGLIVLISIVNLLYIKPSEIVNWWFQGLLLVACMVASVLLFGGAAIRLWHTSNSHKDTHIQQIIDEESTQLSTDHKMDSFLNYFGSSTIIHYASRPNFKEIFGSISKLWGYVDVGVIVCGPQSLEKSVATECRSLNITRQSDDPIFHFNTQTFSF